MPVTPLLSVPVETSSHAPDIRPGRISQPKSRTAFVRQIATAISPINTRGPPARPPACLPTRARENLPILIYLLLRHRSVRSSSSSSFKNIYYRHIIVIVVIHCNGRVSVSVCPRLAGRRFFFSDASSKDVRPEIRRLQPQPTAAAAADLTMIVNVHIGPVVLLLINIVHNGKCFFFLFFALFLLLSFTPQFNGRVIIAKNN